MPKKTKNTIVEKKPKITLAVWSIIVGIVIFFFFLSHLSDYGINWDEPVHFIRGQAYLNYFLTRDSNYKFPGTSGTDYSQNIKAKLQKYQATNPIRTSIYQYEGMSAEYWFINDSGHPPLNGILAAFTNYIFYQKLGIMGDVDSYHLFEIFCGAILVGLLFFFSTKYFGVFPGVIATLSLVFYPLFLGEVHFNIKDPVEATFYTGTIIFFFMAIIRNSWKQIIISSIFCGFALGTKLNILFVPAILLPWLALFWFQKYKTNFKNFFREQRAILISLIMYPFIAFGIFYFTWPYLWQNPVHNLMTIFGYYKNIGSDVTYQPASYYWNGWNLYPVLWIFYTTPPVILFLSAIGIIYSLVRLRNDSKYLGLLILLWFIMPIARVTVPGASIYGGVRQIMEYIPAMAMLSGIGAFAIVIVIRYLFSKGKALQKYTKKSIILIQAVIIFLFILLAIQMNSLHPNENLYFNSLAGGLAGAKEKDIPSWGISFGNVYLQGVKWLNAHVEKNAKVALISGTLANIPRTYFRSDIIFNNNLWSGTDRKGEYMMDMIYQGFPLKSYAYDYIQRYLNPVYELKVDGVTVLEIWKNDKQHTTPGFLNEDTDVHVINKTVTDDMMTLTLDKAVYLTKIDEMYDNTNCDKLTDGFIAVSQDGDLWERQGDNIPVLQVTMNIDPKDKRLVYLFAAKPAKFIRITTNSPKSCVFNPTSITVSELSDKKL